MTTFKSSRGLAWHYDVIGTGDPLVFIHGFGGSGRWWFHQVEFLAKDFQVLTLDLPGHGQSGWEKVTLRDMAVDVRQILNSVGLSHVNVVASSFGGLVALDAYRLMPENIMRMSLVGSLPKLVRAPGYPAGLEVKDIQKLKEQCAKDSAGTLDIFFRSLFTAKERQNPHFQRLKSLRVQETIPQPETAAAFLDILEQADLRDRLASVICPLQFIAGSEDYICPRPALEWVAAHAHNARFDFIEGCGHLPFLTDVEEYNRLLEDFLIN